MPSPRGGWSGSDLGPLIARLRSGPLSDEARELLADLLERVQLINKPGGRARPAYEGPSDDQINVLVAVDDYRERGRKGYESRDDAAKRLAREYGCHWKQIINYLDGNGGTFRDFGPGGEDPPGEK